MNEQKLFILLADYASLELKLRNYHWNITGLNFTVLHELFEKQYDVVAEEVDVVAEQIRKLGSKVNATFSAFHEYSSVDTMNGATNQDAIIQDLIDTNLKIADNIKQLKSDIENSIDEDLKNKNVSTCSLMDDLLKTREKDIWFLQSLLIK